MDRFSFQMVRRWSVSISYQRLSTRSRSVSPIQRVRSHRSATEPIAHYGRAAVHHFWAQGVCRRACTLVRTHVDLVCSHNVSLTTEFNPNDENSLKRSLLYCLIQGSTTIVSDYEMALRRFISVGPTRTRPHQTKESRTVNCTSCISLILVGWF